MRITTQLKVISAVSVLALATLTPFLLERFNAFKQARNDYLLADAIKSNFFERAAFRDQYYLYRERAAQAQWEQSWAKAQGLLRQADSQLQTDNERQSLERLSRCIAETAEIFHRIVNNTERLNTTSVKRPVYEELDKRLYSQLLLKASTVRDLATGLKDASVARVELNLNRLISLVGLFALTLALTILLITWQLDRLMRRRLAPLHEGAKALANGTLSYRIVMRGKDEFTELAQSYNTMADTLTHQQKALATREKLFRTIADTSPLAIYMSLGPEQRAKYINPTFIKLFGYTLDEVPSAAEWWPLAYPDVTYRNSIKEEWQRRAEHAIKTRGSIEPLQVVVTCKNGAQKNISWSFVSLGDQNWAFGLDYTESEQAKAKLQLAANVFEHAREGISITDTDGTIVNVNQAFTRITGYSREEALGQNPRILKSGRQDAEFYVGMWRDLIGQGYWTGEIWNRRKTGEVFAELLTISAVRNDQGITQHYVGLFSDITAIKEHQQQLEHIAHYDALTTLPNRVLLGDRLHQAMAQAQRRGQLLAVVYLDLDGFKVVNDLHGHEAGDQMLITAANRMKQILREGDTLARLGGDEFVAVLLDLDDVEASVPMLSRLLSAAAQPVKINNFMLHVSASIGVTFYPQTDNVEADQLLRQADQAMYQAKLAGKNRYHIFDAEQDRSVRGHHESVERIHLAIHAREFVLHYQPKVNMRSGEVIGAEALIRWQHPEKGLLPPAAFLPLIEDQPQAVALGEWVIENALQQIEQWQAIGLNIPVSVNVGARQLQQADFVERLSALLNAHPQIKPGDLELEVLETSALDDLALASKVIEACRQLGVTFSLDDFGTGYSSLTYLKRLPVTQLKIDQSFVRDMLDDPDDLAILEGVIGLSSAFRRQVIAEGVETVAHGEMLLRLGCERAQGYGIARPMPAEQLPAWAAAWRPDPAWAGLRAVSRDDLPLLFAGIEHRAWVTAIDHALKCGCEAQLPLGFHQCRFGQWLAAEGLARYGMEPTFLAIDSLHQQGHALAETLLQMQAQGQQAQALAQLDQLHDLRDALIEQLMRLLQASRT